MNIKLISVAVIFIILISILSEINNIKTKQQLIMEINWIVVGWIIDMILNGAVWLIIATLSLILIDTTDTWTRKAIKFMDKADKWIRKFIDNLFELIQKKNLKIISSIILLIIFGVLAQLGIIPKLIT